MKLNIIFILVLALTSIHCSPNSKNNKNISPKPSQKTTAEILELFQTTQSFSSIISKTIIKNNQIFALVFSKPNTNSEYSSEIISFRMDSSITAAQKKHKNWTTIDFAINEQGDLIELAYQEVTSSDPKIPFPLKELAVFINSNFAFTVVDSQQLNALKYDENLNALPAMNFDPSRTLFLTSSPLTEFARIQTTADQILISAVGQFGYKIFTFNLQGKELSQIELMPRSEFNTIIMDTEAAYVEVQDSTIISAFTFRQKDADVYQKHFSIPIKWQGASFQTLVQTFDPQKTKRKFELTNTSQNFFISGLSSTSEKFVLYGSTGGPGNRKGFASVYNKNLQNIIQTEFTISNETSIYAATFHQERLIVAGSTGSAQVETGSVIQPADSFLSYISDNGSPTLIHQFGTERNDRVTILNSIENQLVVGGFENGPITHTADHNAQLGYQNWFLGKLNL